MDPLQNSELFFTFQVWCSGLDRSELDVMFVQFLLGVIIKKRYTPVGLNMYYRERESTHSLAKKVDSGLCFV